jgi:hypothetical protein
VLVEVRPDLVVDVDGVERLDILIAGGRSQGGSNCERGMQCEKWGCGFDP